MNKDYIVTKSNTLVTANYDLSLQEQKLILTLASMVQPNDEEFKEYEFKIKEFMELLGVDTKTKYTEIPKITKELMKKVFEIREGQDIVQLSWLSSARYKTGNGVVVLKFDSSLKPYMLQLKELYTSYKLENILSLRSKYSLRLFEVLKSNQFKKVWIVELDELKKILGVTEKSYSVYQNIKNRIVIQAQKELKEKTDIEFNFEEIKTGRKVTSLKFYIHSNKVKKTTENKITHTIDEVSATVVEGIEDDIISEIRNIINRICNKDITDKSANEIYKSALENKDYVNKTLELIKEVAQYSLTQNIKASFVGWFKTMVINYEKPIKKSKQLKFDNFKGRDYDYDDLEKKLLGWD
ncbi:replication initiation protein [Clostridium sp. Sa3CUN1]|uniref:Replication initiation protein n=1 Tax=Clostridium gallinarum TaxID=2762246 RepID=A0ABR8Q779_9CLOT|nr:replication initiation protein [Clostridium gallinarum]MBD7916230.1 replication initiation protein [Clostridium gallinarum]